MHGELPALSHSLTMGQAPSQATPETCACIGREVTVPVGYPGTEWTSRNVQRQSPNSKERVLSKRQGDTSEKLDEPIASGFKF